MSQLTAKRWLVACSFLAITSITHAKKDSQHQHIINAPTQEEGYITFGSDVLQGKKSVLQQFQLTLVQPLSKQSSIAVARIPTNQIDALSEYMHEAHNRCGGFFFHETKQQAIEYAQLSGDPELLAVDYTIDNPEGVNQLVSEMSASQLTSTVNALSSFNNRYYTQQSGVDAANWIRQTWSDISANRNDISVELYNHSWNQPSVIATVTGTSLPDEVVIIGGHLDSINSRNASTGRAPGADDNASGIAVATETLRAMVASGYRPARTIKFMGYAAEEVGLRGSKAIAQNFKSNNINVVGVAQFDMTGVKGTNNLDIVFMTDYTNAAQNNFMMQLLDTYFPNISHGTSRCGYGCSDHASWHNEGYPASIPFESTFNDSNNRIHTSNDTVFDSSHSIKFARLSAAFVAELGKQGDITPPPPPPPLVLINDVPVTGLSENRGDDVVYTMEVPAGAKNISFSISGGSGDADLYTRFGSEPTDSAYDCRPYRNGNNETCSGSQSGGIYYIRVKAYSNFSGVSLVGSYDEDTGGGTDPIDESFSINLARGEWEYFTFDLTAGYSDLNVSISGGTGDADIYVRKGERPTTSSYDCRPYRNGNNETCSFSNPDAEIWHVGVRGYRDSSGVTLSVKADP
ncbi:MAG: M20/M25/M40 family metallo-hydrolase [Gammaproteobacteria bacterium]|nr:M20/M25/M40 family metallo-hydrolase [Gammaproteobacteria bacterium]